MKQENKFTQTPTKIEIEIVQLAADGYMVSEIAAKRKRNYKTIEVQMYNLRKKYDCPNTANLVAEFLRNNLIK